MLAMTEVVDFGVADGRIGTGLAITHVARADGEPDVTGNLLGSELAADGQRSRPVEQDRPDVRVVGEQVKRCRGDPRQPATHVQLDDRRGFAPDVTDLYVADEQVLRTPPASRGFPGRLMSLLTPDRYSSAISTSPAAYC